MDSHSLPQSVVNQKRSSTPEGMAYCCRCDSYKSTSEFCVDKSKNNGLCIYCKTCQAIKRNTPENKAKLAEYNARPERKAKQAEYAISRTLKPDYKIKAAIRNKKYHETPEYKKKKSIYNAQPERRKKISAYNARPEQKAKRAELRARPEEKEKQKMYMSTYKLTPEQQEKKLEYNRAYNQSLARKRDKAAWDRKRKYGVTQEIYLALLESQNGACAICKKPETVKRNGEILPLCIDHDHDTKAVRGLLCRACNSALGHFDDSISNLSSAIDYLKRSNQK